MINAQLKNTVPNARNRGDIVNARGSMGSIGTPIPSVTTFGGLGYLIGMLGLTYTIPHTITGSVITIGGMGIGPNVRIANT